MRLAAVLAAVCLTGLPHGGVPAAESPNLTWFTEDGSVAWTAHLEPRLVADAPEAAVPLEVGPRYPRLPGLELDLIDGDGSTLDPRGLAGQVLILEFWASWCGPCAEALPRLQQLQAAEQKRGLRVITVNMKETDHVARQFSSALDLSLPIARYTRPMHEALSVESLPTVIVADREGRIRARFDGYRPGLEDRIARIARELLADGAVATEQIARVVHGAGALEARWSREVTARVTDLAVSPESDVAVMAATGWDLIILGPAGQVRSTKRVGRGVEQLRVDGTSPGTSVVFGFRPVGRRIARIPLGEGEPSTWESQGNVLDLLVEADGGERPRSLLIGALDGLRRVAHDGSSIRPAEGGGPVWQLGRGSNALLALRAGRLQWLGPSLETQRQVAVPETARVLVSEAELVAGFGVAPEDVESAVVGRFLGRGDRAQTALVFREQLVVFDLEAGAERFRASWPGITAVAAGDLDDDGRDELIVGSGKRVTALGAPGPARSSS